MLQRISIPDLHGGVSRQPDSQRFPNQMEECDNAFLHMTSGLEKRSGFEMIKDLSNISGDQLIHWIDRSPNERYFVSFRNDVNTPIRIFKIDGTECSIEVVDAGAKTYVTTNPVNLKAITIDDTTIIVNTSITASFDSSTVTYNFDGSAVDSADNPHNKASWEEFDLPPQATGEYWYARDDALGHPAGWYESISTTTQPWYKRVRTPMANSKLDASTMPVRILQTGETSFQLTFLPWVPRYSGDSLTNPGPSFAGKRITDVCVHRNRLWFSANENVIGSASGDFYNFWLDSYATVIDSDPIDVKLSSSFVSSITWMIPFSRAIVVFTNSGQQYEIRAREALTPSSVSIVPSTTYTSPKTRPLILGSQLYWTADKGPFSQMYEYIVDEETATSFASDSAAHVDGYLSNQINEMKGTTSADMIFLRKGNTVYVNFMFWQGQKKLQNAWTRWSMLGIDTILGLHVFDDHLYMLSRINTSAASTLRIDRLPLRHNDEIVNNVFTYRPRMDCIVHAEGTYNGNTKQTTFTIPFNVSNLDTLYQGPGWKNAEGGRYPILSCTPNGKDSTTVIVSGKLDGSECILGRSYEFSVKLSKQYVRDQSGTPAVGTLQIKQATLYHRNTGYIDFVIDPRITNTNQRTWTYTGKQIGSIGFITNVNVLSDKDVQHYKVMGSARTIEMYIKSQSPAPTNVTGMEFTVDFVPGKRSIASN